MMLQKNMTLPPLADIDLMVGVLETLSDSPVRDPDSHTHDRCEIYVNLSGDVSFMVEDRLYTITPGSVILTRPYEYHHCIYRRAEPHRHLWLLFSGEPDSALFRLFYRRQAGRENLLLLDPEQRAEMETLCLELQEPLPPEGQYRRFLRILELLHQAAPQSTEPRREPKALAAAMEYFSEHLREPLTVRQVAEATHVSVNTLERHFLEYLNMKPWEYLRKKRLANAARLLSEGCSVAEAGTESGFQDYSHFIALFRKTYGITPLQYRKRQGK